MIHIPLINKVLRINTVNAKKDKTIIAMAKEIKQLSKHPKWIAFLKKAKEDENFQ